MKQSGKIIALAVAVLIGGVAGYWAGKQKTQDTGEGAAGEAAERRILYYRNPMGLPDTSPVPKKDSMGMDYVPVYEDEVNNRPNQLRIGVEKVQKLGVKTEAAALRKLTQTIRAVGRIEQNERRVYSIAPKFEGWVETLHVNAVGDIVQSGQSLFEVYSPELVSAQREYLIAAQGGASLQGASQEAQSGMQALADSSLSRLKSWGIGDSELLQLRNTGEAKRTLIYRSPVQGVVLEKPAVQGMRFMPGETLYKIADLSTVWIMADVFEQDIALIKAGQDVRVRLDAFPGREFNTRVAYIYPTLNEQTRTIPVRMELANGDGLLRPGMYVQIELHAAKNSIAVVTVPDSAVIHSGRRTVVLVELGEGYYDAREVRLGRHADDAIEVLAGIAEGERVVVSANFLIDAESNLKAVIGSLGAPAMESEHPGH